MGLYISIAINIILAIVVVVKVIFPHIDGILYIDKRDPEKDRYKFMVEDLDKLATKKKVIIKVDANAVLD